MQPPQPTRQGSRLRKRGSKGRSARRAAATAAAAAVEAEAEAAGRAPPPPPPPREVRQEGVDPRKAAGATAEAERGQEGHEEERAGGDDELADPLYEPDPRARERVANFFVLPLYFERVMFFGSLLCIDNFLSLVTTLPWRCARLLVSVPLAFVLRRPSPLGVASVRRDVFNFMTLGVCFLVLTGLDMSRLYHYVRHQSVIKIYVLFNMAQIFEKMAASVGQDIMDAGMQAATVEGARPLSVAVHWAAALVYTAVHSLILVTMVIALNVSLNSKSNSLFVVLVSNNFLELKTTVFRRFRIENMFQITCMDIVERFQLACFLLTIVVHNLSHIGLEHAAGWLNEAGVVCLAIYASEFLVDWLKHGFITKFNLIHPVVYRRFAYVLYADVVGVGTVSVQRRLGMLPFPIAVTVLRVCAQALLHAGGLSASVRVLLLVSVCVVVGFLKRWIRVVIEGHSCKALLAAGEAVEEAMDASASASEFGFTGPPRSKGKPLPSTTFRTSEATFEAIAATKRYELVGNKLP